ncbi:MAG TPA: glycosyltransferase [Lactovum miscens]|uniref:glycosyltransferase family 2 protein n=1 Tax=Lactovum miscens TaxID=190387 RepID=UPI002EDABAB5
MNIKKNYNAIAVFSLIFLFLFNLELLFRITGLSFADNSYAVLFFIIPLIVGATTIVRDKEKVPKWIRIFSLIALSSFALYTLNSSIISIVYSSGGEVMGMNLSLYKPFLLALILVLVGFAYFLSRKRQLLQNLAIALAAIWVITLLTLAIILIIHYKTFTITVIDMMNPQFLISPVMSIVYLGFYKSDEANRKKIGQRILVMSLLFILGSFISYFVALTLKVEIVHLNLFSFFQENVIYTLKMDYGSVLSNWLVILLVVTQVMVVLFSATFLIYSEDFENSEKLNFKKPMIYGLLALIFCALILYLFNSTSDYYVFTTTLFGSYFILQIAEIFLIMGLVFFIGLKKYYRQGSKLLIYIFSTFPILYLLHIKYIVNRNNILGSDIVQIFNILLVVFSAFVFLFYTTETFSLWYAYGRKKRTSDLKDVDLMKSYYMYVLIPCMNEELVIQNTVKSLLRNKYRNLRVTIIDDASEDKTLEQVSAVQDDRLSVLKRIKPEAQQGKGEALNWAFYQISDEIKKKGIPAEDVLIAIIDADTQVEENYFEKVNLAFNADEALTGLQSKVRVITKNRDTAQDLEFSEIINASQALRTLTNTVAFGGNGQFCKLSTMQGLNEKPWTKSLVEDFDLSTRLFLEDVNVKNTQYDDIFIEQTGILNDNKALVRQRVRWSQGNIQSSKYIFPILKSNKLELIQKIELLFTLLKPWIMGIEYFIVFFTYVLLVDLFIIGGVTSSFRSFIIIFVIMAIYILLTNLVWAILYNRKRERGIKILNVITDTYYLCKFMAVLSQIYPQSAIRHFRAQESWKKTERK